MIITKSVNFPKYRNKLNHIIRLPKKKKLSDKFDNCFTGICLIEIILCVIIIEAQISMVLNLELHKASSICHFFIIYTNDISYVSTKSSLIYFRMMLMFFYQGSYHRELQDTVCYDLWKYYDHWFSANKLPLKINRTKYVVYGPLSKN